MESPTFDESKLPRPRIGLCAYHARARWGVWDDEIAFVPRTYLHAVHRAGGAAVILAPDPVWVNEPDEALTGLDGLILCGGVDVSPEAYGAERHPLTDEGDPERDEFELALARRALETDVPFLGICRGMQLMNVAAGGTLIQHLPDVLGHEHHRHQPGTFGDHPVELEPGSLAARAAGETTHNTKSHHHQALEQVADVYRVTGWSADGDRLVEAIEAPDRRFALGVQWHPEADETSRVVAALVDEARAQLTQRNKETVR